jgi:hypothetical protein
VKRILILCAVAVFTSLSVFAQAPVPRVGIISDAGARKEADLLLIELQKAKCELVERDQIAKVLGEQALQIGLCRKDSQRVGQMLKADGLILLSAGTNDMITVRFVAVAPGVMLWFGDCSAKNGVALSKTLAVTLAPFLPKLAVKKSEALPISLLRIRPGLGTVQAAQLATELYRLLQLRLVREPALFVLERDNLRQMDEEQRWAGKDSEFWAGSYLVEGSVRHDVIETNQVTLSLVVRPPATAGKTGAAAATIEEKGRIDELAQLIERATVKVCAGFGARATAPAWDTAQEGTQFAALAGRLLDPAQAKVALEAAMALGCRDQKTAHAYAAALCAIALRGHPGYIHLAEPAHRKEQAGDLLAYLGFVNSYQPPGGFTPETEKRWLLGYWPPVTTGCDYLVEVHDGEAGDELKEWIPKIQEQCRQLLDRTLACAPGLAPGARATRVCHYGRYLYPRMADCLNLYRKTGPGVMEQNRVEPVFPTAATEPADQRKALWEAFRREMETSAPVEARFLAWCGKIPKAMDGAARPEIAALRRQLQDELMTHPEFWPMIVNQDAFIGRYLFPDFQPWEGKMLQLHPGGLSELPEWFEVKAEAVQEHTERGYQWFLALMKTAPAKLQSLRPPSPGIKIIHFPYVAFFSAAQAKEVNNTILARDLQLANVATTNKTDLTYLREALAARFPKLADAAYKAKQINIAAGQTAAERARARALRVTREYANLTGPRYEGWLPPFTVVRWRHNQFWCYWTDDILCVDISTRKCAVREVPLPMEPIKHTKPNAGQLVVTDSLVAYFLNHYNSLPNEKDFSSKLALRKPDEQAWRIHQFPFHMENLTQVGGTLYAVIEIPTVTIYSCKGFATIDPATFKSAILVEPVPNAHPPQPESTNAVLVAPAYGTELAATATELLVRYENRYCVAWNPATKATRRATEQEWLAASTPPDPYRQASLRYGFEILNTPSGILGPDIPDGGGTFPVRVKLPGSSQVVDVPIWIDEPPTDNMEKWKGCQRIPICVDTGILLPYAENSLRRGFWEIPYADIQQWLAANPPKAGESAPAANKPTTAVDKPGPNAPTPPAPKTK